MYSSRSGKVLHKSFSRRLYRKFFLLKFASRGASSFLLNLVSTGFSKLLGGHAIR